MTEPALSLFWTSAHRLRPISPSVRVITDQTRGGPDCDPQRGRCASKMKSRVGRHSRWFWLIAGGASIASSAGCSAPKREAAWTAKPRVEWSDITIRSVEELNNEYRILTTAPT